MSTDDDQSDWQSQPNDQLRPGDLPRVSQDELLQLAYRSVVALSQTSMALSEYLDTVATLLRPVDFYVKAHNSEIPHAAFNGPTPDEMYFGTGSDLPDRMQAGKAKAREARLAASRNTSCRECQRGCP